MGPPRVLPATLLLATFHLLLATVATGSTLQTPANRRYLVTSLPNYDQPVEHYAGLVTVGATRGAQLFFYYVPARHNPTTSPVLVWLQNSMACSSMAGFLYEHGPVRFQDPTNFQSHLTANPHSWHLVANMVYLDIPAGNGFSSTANYGNGTNAWGAAGQVVQFLQAFHHLFPALRRAPLYLSAETVGVPTMLNAATRVANEMPSARLRGYIAISGWTNMCLYRQKAQLDFLLQGGFIPASEYQRVLRSCTNLCTTTSIACPALLYLTGYVLQNLSDRLTRVPVSCPDSAAAPPPPAASLTTAPSSTRRLPATPLRPSGGPMTCSRLGLAAEYLNSNATRAALHLPPFVPTDPSSRWQACRGLSPLTNFYEDLTPTLPRHQDLLRSRGMRALLLHGSQDFNAPAAGARRLAVDIGLPSSLSATPVVIRGRQVGQAHAYGGGVGRQLSLVVLKGAGAYVAEDAPGAAVEVVKRFLARRNVEK